MLVSEHYHRFRSELGHNFKGPNGFNAPCVEKESCHETLLSNFKFYDTPAAAEMCIHEMSSKTDVIRNELGIGENREVLYTLATAFENGSESPSIRSRSREELRAAIFASLLN